MKKILIVGIIIVVIIVFILLNLSNNKGKTIPVQTGKVERGNIVQKVNASGLIEPVTEVKISANISAKIMKITVEEGDRVKKGQLLVELDSAQYKAAYDKALSNLESAKASKRKVDSDLKRIKALYEKNLASESELEAAIAQAELAKSQVIQAEAMVKQAADDLSKTKISSPITGTVTDIRKEEGEIALGSVFQADVILVVSDLSQMKAKVEVDETDVVNITEGDSAIVEIDAIPDKKFRGIVAEVAHSATIKNPGTMEQIANFEVEISLLDIDPKMRPGMSVTADIITDRRDSTIVVPIQCVTFRENQNTKIPLKIKSPQEIVFVIKQPDELPDTSRYRKYKTPVAIARPVKLGISSDTHFEILEGLEEGEQIVTGSFKAISKDLYDGAPVKILNKKAKEERK
ncbi:MAG: efflux RND transporter periplasmic adaptor subunit [Candidatus Marinimicrobia bacterium]|nr:efflux RND transporter periplasmic adaptor subunit [Candidatus Neomarinimicrobiota bacterium]